MAGLTPRRATLADLDTIAGLTAAYRKDLAGWAPQWWQPAESADDLHRAWLAHLLDDGMAVVRVLDAGDRVAACAVTTRQGRNWVVDDIAIDPKVSWTHLGPKLFGAVTERPALAGIAVEDFPRATAADRSGLTRASSYWLRATEAGALDVEPVPPHTSVPDAPAHTFDGPLDPDAEGALSFAVPGGLVVASTPLSAPPVYDPGGSVCVADRIVGTNRGPLLRSLLAAAHDRGDALALVVCGADDTELAALLTAGGFQRTVNVFAWSD